MVVWLEKKTWVIGKDGTKGGVGRGVREEVWGLLGFVALVCLGVFPLL
jgi:hypothetical protein